MVRIPGHSEDERGIRDGGGIHYDSGAAVDLEKEKEMIKRILIHAVLVLLCLFIWLPLLLMAGSALMSEGEMLERFGAVFGMGNAPIKAAFIPPTQPEPLCGAAFGFTGILCYVLEFLSADRLVLAGQLLIALPAPGPLPISVFPERGHCFFSISFS